MGVPRISFDQILCSIWCSGIYKCQRSLTVWSGGWRSWAIEACWVHHDRALGKQTRGSTSSTNHSHSTSSRSLPQILARQKWTYLMIVMCCVCACAHCSLLEELHLPIFVGWAESCEWDGKYRYYKQTLFLWTLWAATVEELLQA